jgi:hypothetical protein
MRSIALLVLLAFVFFSFSFDILFPWLQHDLGEGLNDGLACKP